MSGLAYALLTYGFWGLVPIYWKLVTTVPAPQLVAQRVLWSLVTLCFFVATPVKLKALRAILSDRRKVLWLCVSSLCLSANWLLFVVGIEEKMLLQVSLGYFINPLVSILLGRIFLGEILNIRQKLAFFVAVLGVVTMSLTVGQVPYLSLAVALTFGFYGLVRKKAALDPLLGLTTETLLMSPPALAYLCYENARGNLPMLHDLGLLGRVMLSGPITTFPLLWFAHAANLVSLSTLGFLQYLSPTMQFLLAVVVYKEPFTKEHFAAFALIWCSLAIYIGDALLQLRAQRQLQKRA